MPRFVFNCIENLSMKKLLYFVFAIALSIGMFSCKKDQFTSSGKLNFSKDTILFDTIFTEVGSTTLQFKIYNNNNQKINIKEIRLMGGSTSPFRMNIDGDNADYIENVEIEAEDSLFGFVEVTLGVNGSSFPMVVEDSIQFVTNGTPQYVQLRTWGQDVYVHNKEIIGADDTWPNDKPHLVYGYVAVDSSFNLTIQENTDIHFHKDAQFIVYKSSLNVIGQQTGKVTFQGDRLESFYDDVAGQWYGVRFIEPKNSRMEWCIVKNGTVGVQVDSTFDLSQNVELVNTEIINQDFFGIWANAGARVYGENLKINACNQHSVFLFAGGEYDFRHCTFGGFNTTSRQTPVFRLQNYFLGAGNTIFVRDVQATIKNSIIYGGLESELTVDTIYNPTSFIEFSNSLIKNATVGDAITYPQCIWNQNPNFVSNTDLHLTLGSPAIGVGLDGVSFIGFDLDNENWFSPPSAGCYNAP